jgi:hypothetical protein
MRATIAVVKPTGDQYSRAGARTVTKPGNEADYSGENLLARGNARFSSENVGQA